MAAPIYISTNSALEFPFSASSPTLDFLILVILSRMRWYFIVVLICISLMIRDIEHLFTYLWAICRLSLEKCVFGSYAHFFNRIVCFSGVKLYKFFIYFGFQPLIGCIICSHSPIFVFDGFLCYIKTFYFGVVLTVCYCFCFPCLRRYTYK